MARAVAISAGISSGRPMIGPIRSRARVWTAIAETSVPITAIPMSASASTAMHAGQRGAEPGPSSSRSNAGTAITSSTTR